MASGFSRLGHEVTGADISDDAKKVAAQNDILDRFLDVDLGNSSVFDGYDIILGGPPCKPWSSVNTTKRKEDHDDYGLVKRFFDHLDGNNPDVFLMENVPPLKGDRILERELQDLQMSGRYSVHKKVVKYSDYGAATKRKRLIVFGIRDGNASEFFENLKKYRAEATTVGERIGHLPEEEDPQIKHVWPNLTTIHKYKDYYESGKFGWYILKEDEPAPSFGNVTKTYILPPSGKKLLDDDHNSKENPPRVISVREAALIMGFDEDFKIPEELGMSNSYQLIVDSVSPDFSEVAAKAVQDTLQN